MIADFFKYTVLYFLLPILQRHGRQLFLGLFLVGSLVWWGDRQAWFRQPFRNTRALEAFSNQTALLLDLPPDKAPLKTLRQAAYAKALWKLGVLDQWQTGLQQLETLLTQTTTQNDFWRQARIVSGLQVTSNRDAQWLYAMEQVDQVVTLSMLVEVLQPDEVERSLYRDHQIYTLQLGQTQWAVAQFRGLLLWSRATVLVESAIEQLDKISGSVYHDGDYHQMARQLDETQLRLYWNWSNWVSLTNVVTHTNPRLLLGLQSVGTWAGMVWRHFERGFQLQGTTYPAADNTFLKALARQEAPKQSKVVTLLPTNFSALLYWGWSDARTLYQQSTTKEHPAFEQYILPWLGRDCTLLYEDPTDEENAFAKNKLLLVHCPDTTLAWKRLRQYAAVHGEAKTYAYQNFEVHHLPVSGPFAPLLGDLLRPLDQPYYTFIGEYVVFANAASTLEGWIKRFNTRSMLLQDSLYAPVLGQLRNGSNLYALLNTPNATKLLQYLARADQEALVLEALKGWEDLYPIGIQWHGQGDRFQLACSVEYHPSTPKQPVKAASSWQADLEAPAIIAPQPIRSHDGNYYVFVQDAHRRLYLLDKNGENRWAEPLVLTRPVNSPIYPIDFYSNQQVQYAFSTDSAIYVISQTGQRLMTIPLIHRAASGVAVVDYGKGPRFFIACKNGTVYGYEERGKPLSGWQPQKGVGRLTTPMAYLEYEAQRYFIAVTRAGTCRAYKRNGASYFLKGKLGMGLTGWGIDPSIGRIAGGSKKGRIRVLNTRGKGFGLAPVKDLKPPVQFLYADVVGDARKDYIRVDAQKIAVHAYQPQTDEKGRTKEVLQEMGLYDIPVANDRVVFEVQLYGRSKSYIGYWDRATGSIGLLDATGQLQRGFPLAGTSRFAVVDLFNEQGNTLVVANGNRVYTYKLK